ncbi:hypothetical protein FQA39_LY09352 [Lamprigera yunnana]|nr:hypothetical protein FQA39_LY09352 [Lamprigera yunnana]
MRSLLFEAASALNADNSDIEDDVTETTSADIGDCDLWVPEDEEEDEENEEEDEENVENKISDSEVEASGNSRRTNKAISNLKCKKERIARELLSDNYETTEAEEPTRNKARKSTALHKLGKYEGKVRDNRKMCLSYYEKLQEAAGTAHARKKKLNDTYNNLGRKNEELIIGEGNAHHGVSGVENLDTNRKEIQKTSNNQSANIKEVHHPNENLAGRSGLQKLREEETTPPGGFKAALSPEIVCLFPKASNRANRT